MKLQYDFIKDAFLVQQPKLSSGYAGHPGSGPDGETCGSCGCCQEQSGVANRYYKCAWTSTRSEATDLRLKTPACDRWEPEIRNEDETTTTA